MGSEDCSDLKFEIGHVLFRPNPGARKTTPDGLRSNVLRLEALLEFVLIT